MPKFSRFMPMKRKGFTGGPPLPEVPFYAIGDVHGRYDLLEPLLDRLLAIGDPIVLVGDYVDRGEDSAAVLRLLQQAPDHVICLFGNHEDMLLHFIDEPRKYGRNWLRHGGLQALSSFGIGGISEASNGDMLTDARDRLVDQMGGLVGWIRNLPRYWQSGNVGVVHAGADPALPLALQSTDTMAWGHPDFCTTPREDGLWIIHGHTVVPLPLIRDGRAAIDTGAFATGRLTAVQVTEGTITPLD